MNALKICLRGLFLAAVAALILLAGTGSGSPVEGQGSVIGSFHMGPYAGPANSCPNDPLTEKEVLEENSDYVQNTSPIGIDTSVSKSVTHHSCNQKGFVNACFEQLARPTVQDLANDCSRPLLETAKDIIGCGQCVSGLFQCIPKCGAGPLVCTVSCAQPFLDCVDCGVALYEVQHCRSLVKQYELNALASCRAAYAQNPCAFRYEGNDCPVTDCSPDGYAFISEKSRCLDEQRMRFTAKECISCEYEVTTEDVACPQGMYCDEHRGGAQCIASCIQFPELCDDGDSCTRDECDVSSGNCRHVPTSPCCGNDVCESSETSSSCPQDCPEGPGNDHPDDLSLIHISEPTRPY